MVRRKRRARRATRSAEATASIERVADAEVASAHVEEGSAPLTPGALPEFTPREEEQPADEATDAGDAGPSDGASDRSGGSDSDAPSPPLTPDAVVGMIDLALYVSVRCVAASAKVPWGPDVERIARMTPAERAALLAFAPSAVPYLRSLLESAPFVGVAAFGGLAVVTVVSHMAQVKDLAKGTSSREPRAPTPSDSARPVDAVQPESGTPPPAGVVITSQLPDLYAGTAPPT